MTPVNMAGGHRAINSRHAASLPFATPGPMEGPASRETLPADKKTAAPGKVAAAWAIRANIDRELGEITAKRFHPKQSTAHASFAFRYANKDLASSQTGQRRKRPCGMHHFRRLQRADAPNRGGGQ